jgi:hypothetical protein
LACLASYHRRRQECLELLAFGCGKVAPDGGAIGVATLADIFEDGGYLLGEFVIVFGNGGADKFKAFGVGSHI